MTIALFLDGSRSSPAFRVASSAPRRDGAASGGSERPRRRGRAADLCGGHGGRGRQRRLWPWFGRGSGEVTEGFRTLAVDFRAVLWDVEWYSYLLFKDPLFVLGWASWNSGKRNDSTKHGGHEWKARGHKCSLDLELLITLSWIPHLSFKKMKRLITVVWHELWAETSCQKRPQVGGMQWFSWFVADMCSEFETWKHIGSFKSKPWALTCQTWPDIKNSAWQMPWVLFLAWENDLSVHIRKTFRVPTPKTPPSRLRPNALRPGQGGPSPRPPPGDGPPAPSLLAAVLEPWRRSTMMDHISHLTLVWPMILSNILDTMGVERQTDMRKHYPSRVWKFVSFINWPPDMRIKPSNIGIYFTAELHFTATYTQPFNNYLSCRCWLLVICAMVKTWNVFP